jgi:membrane associated rhomboid family serine protease
MKDQFGASGEKRSPIIDAPVLVVLTSILLVGMHTAFAFASIDQQERILWDYALVPGRFWAAAGSSYVYPDHISGLLTLVSSSLLHADWQHVIINAAMLLVFGWPVARALGQNARGWALWMLLFVGSVVGGSGLYLALVDADAPLVIGASGGVSGLLAAYFLLDPWGGKRPLWSPRFVVFSTIFVLANLLLVFLEPHLSGMIISWQAHLGGYIAGAILMTLVPVRAHAGSRL